MRTLVLVTAMIAMVSPATAEPLDWASSAQRDIIARLASAVASVEPCDGELNRDRLSGVIRQTFGSNLSAQQAADVLYAVTTAEAIQGVQMRGLSATAKKERCDLFKRHFGPAGTDIRGVLN